MKVKGGGRRKGWEPLLPVNTEEEEENFGGDSNTNSNTNTTNPPPQNGPPPYILAFEDAAQPVNSAAVGVVQPEPEADAEEDDADADVDDEADDDADADGNAERPKLDEGFYEIEAIRRKRVRKVHSFSHKFFIF